MPSQVLTSVENNFTKGLITEFTGLNFPENAATDCDNVQFSLIGDVSRRPGINYETNYSSFTTDRSNKAVSTYKWNNAGGDGSTQVVVSQIGGTLYFYKSSGATITSPLSSQKLVSTVDVSSFVAFGATFDATVECDYATGNGYLFVYHPTCDPFYCTYVSGTITGNVINVQIRDFQGLADGLDVNDRPTTLSDPHLYNLSNQGWTKGAAWSATSATRVSVSTGSKVFTVAAGITGVTIGDAVVIDGLKFPPVVLPGVAIGNVTAYAGTLMTVNITSISGLWSSNEPFILNYLITPTNKGYITTWNTAIGSYPSNADQWWTFKNSSDAFDPATTLNNTTLDISDAPKGHFVLGAFNQNRDSAAAISGLTTVSTIKRPSNGAWFQGRVWYTGLNDTFAATSTSNAYSWTETIYFSRIVHTPDDFGRCYQLNDPTSELLFDELPTDGGEIRIQGSGAIYKLFPLQNSLLVFAANGIWYITGSQGIGFAANDYTIYKLSEVRSISGTSIVNVNGFPYFWNEEGIYSVMPGKQDNAPDARRNAIEVTPITVGTILSFYEAIPSSSKKYARGAYDPLDYTIKWIYKSDEAATTSTRYAFDKVLNFNTYNNAFYPYSVGGVGSTSKINSIVYVSSPGGTGAPDPAIKYLSSHADSGSHVITFAEEYDTSYTDWTATASVSYDSYFVTGYKLHGGALHRFQMPYIYVFSRADTPTSYKIQGIWDYATSGNSGRWSTLQRVNNWSPNFGMIFRRHKIRGQGIALQIKVTSVDGQPFDLMGWSSFETQNTGI
jgi:hypothetical protein